MQYKTKVKIDSTSQSIVVCSLGDASITEGEVAEAWQMAALKQLPILYLVQDNGWDISATASEIRAMNAFEYVQGFNGIEAIQVDGADFEACYTTLSQVLHTMRNEQRPFLIHATVPLLNHHTSGVRKEWYRHDLEEAQKKDPFDKLVSVLINHGFSAEELNVIYLDIVKEIKSCLEDALSMPEPTPEDVRKHDFAPTPIISESGTRCPLDAEDTVMVDAALMGIQELMEKHPECLLYGQDVGARLGGVFREAATLAQKFGDHRVFNTAIQEAFIVGSTVGMSAVGLKPIVEVQFADYIWPGLNQLFSEVSRSCYLSNGKWPVSMILRVPIGAYGSGGPYHSGSVESILVNIKGIKIVYPSNGADLKGLLKAAYYDPNPVVILEHKGLYWSKVKGTESAKRPLASEDYILPLGKANMVWESSVSSQNSRVLVITYGMGVHWALNISEKTKQQIGILDLRSLYPLDEDMIIKKVKEYNKVVIVTEEPLSGSFAQSLAGFIQRHCFTYLDGPIGLVGAINLPAIPLNEVLEKTMLPNAQKVEKEILDILQF